MISLSTCTTVPSTWSSHITVSFLWTYKGYFYAPCMFIIDQNVLNSFFLIPQFLLCTSCPWPNHCCLTQVTHVEQKQKTRSCHHPVQGIPFLDLNGSHQHLQLHWWHWHNYHPVFQSLAQNLLQWYCLWWKMVGQNCSWQEMSHWNCDRPPQNELEVPSGCLELERKMGVGGVRCRFWDFGKMLKSSLSFP